MMAVPFSLLTARADDAGTDASLRQRSVTTEGVFPIYEAPIGAGSDGDGPYLAWWRDYRDNR